MAYQNMNYGQEGTEFVPAIDAQETGRHVFALLQERGYSVRQATQIVGCERPQVVYNWKYGRGMPSIDSLDRISRVLQVSINDLLVHVGDEIPGQLETNPAA